MNSTPGTPEVIARWTGPTTAFWQALEPLAGWQDRLAPPYRHGVPVRLDDEQVLVLPIRPVPSTPGRALASLITNQAAFEVVDALALRMGRLAEAFQPEVVLGLPTLGLALAPGVARALGHPRFVPMGYSRKFWYDEALSTTVSSVTTPGAGKAIYLDPNQWPLLAGRRTVIVDDVVSSGQTLAQVWSLLEQLGVPVAGSVVAMSQGSAWRSTLGPERASRLAAVMASQHLQLADDGWWPVEASPPA